MYWATCPLPTARNVLFQKLITTKPRGSSSSVFCTASLPAQDRYAIVGGGVAGLATAWHLIASAPRAIHVDLFEAYELGSGGSGAAAGLLHPYNPRARYLWKGQEAFKDAAKLVHIADKETAGMSHPIAWYNGILRPAKDFRQCTEFRKNAPELCVSDLEELLGGMAAPFPCGLYVREAIVVDPIRYLHALWRACANKAEQVGGSATLHTNVVVPRLADISDDYTSVIVATGAAIGVLPETRSLLKMVDLCQGYTTELKRNTGARGYPLRAPSILGPTYIAAHGDSRLVVGATKKSGLTSEQALEHLRHARNDEETDAGESEEAAQYLLSEASKVWPPIESDCWKISGVRSGVRALPQRTQQGAIPYAGSLPGSNDRWWIVCGLGARGLLYHSFLGRVVAQAILFGSPLPKELECWKE